jgi:hypothetical protein
MSVFGCVGAGAVTATGMGMRIGHTGNGDEDIVALELALVELESVGTAGGKDALLGVAGLTLWGNTMIVSLRAHLRLNGISM